jgi:plasmid maintenance system antidote protein VapI
MALRIGSFLGNGPQLWLDMQNKLDLWKAGQKLGDHLPTKYARAA